MIATTYSHISGQPLQDWYKVRIETHDLPEDQQYHAPGTAILVTTRKQVIFCSRIHENKEVAFPITYSGQFTDADILKDPEFISWVLKCYGSVWARQ